MMKPFNSQRHFFDCKPDCPEREPGCHDHCERYLTKRAQLDDLNAKERKRKEMDAYTIEQISKHKNERAMRAKVYPDKRNHP